MFIKLHANIRSGRKIRDDAIPPFEFENRAVIALGGRKNKAQLGDKGIGGGIFPVPALDNIHEAGADELALEEPFYPMQVKKIDKTSRPEIDAFETAVRRAKCENDFLFPSTRPFSKAYFPILALRQRIDIQIFGLRHWVTYLKKDSCRKCSFALQRLFEVAQRINQRFDQEGARELDAEKASSPDMLVVERLPVRRLLREEFVAVDVNLMFMDSTAPVLFVQQIPQTEVFQDRLNVFNSLRGTRPSGTSSKHQ